jgi:plasmid stabilization system protein ParE
MNLRFTRRAARDLEDIADYIREQNAVAATHVRAAIIRSLQTLALFPHIGRRQTTDGVRKFVARPYRYLVYYAVDDAAKEIAILTIQHPARGRPYTDR